MTCNYSGLNDPAVTAGWTIVDFDWSNDKAEWAAAKPMDCEERLVTQVQLTAAASPGTTSFVYRNAIKALPWYTLVRNKVTDPAYAAWFMKFGPPTVGNGWHVPQCDTNYDPPLCTDLYHDQEQTPGYPTGDGNCAAPACDVGSVPVGEYLFDFRALNVSVNNQTFLEWYIDEYFMGPTGGGNANVSGFYVDDGWSMSGPSEMDANAVVDMNLSTSDLTEIVGAYNIAVNAAYAAVDAGGKFVWDQFLNHDPYAPENGDCPQPWVKQATCASDLASLCTADSPVQSRALLYGFSPGSCTGTDPSHLTEADQDIANFLLVRGPYAYLGSGWSGCGIKSFDYPTGLSLDYGEPLGVCVETAAGSGVFQREWTKATVQMDCNTWTPTITFKGD